MENFTHLEFQRKIDSNPGQTDRQIEQKHQTEKKPESYQNIFFL